MNTFVKTAWISGLAFGLPMGLLAGVVIGLSKGFTVGFAAGFAIALTSGLAFGLALAGVLTAFVAVQRRRFAKMRAGFEPGTLRFDGPANHFLNGEGVGGWLFLTNDSLCFRSHTVNLQPHELSIPLGEIVEVHAVRTAKLFPNGLRLITRSGSGEHFVVEGHQRWRDAIVQAQAGRGPVRRDPCGDRALEGG